MGDKVRKHIYISGHVQGVGFRASLRRKAQQLDIKGWVRNIFDGRVETIVAGNQEKIDQIMRYIKRGPGMARVKDVEVNDEDYRNEFDTFRVKY